MKKMTGIVMMIVGIILVGGGFVLYRNSNETSKVEPLEALTTEPKNTVDESKQKGDDFERYIVENFESKYYKIMEWTSDKEANGKYVESNTNPDIVMQLEWKGQKHQFALECKYRQNYYKGGIEFSNIDQLNRYRKFAEERNLPVFMAVGIGGEAKSPKELFIIPLTQLDKGTLTKSEIAKFYKNPETKFFYKFVTKTLE
jgi:hypothetical protein